MAGPRIGFGSASIAGLCRQEKKYYAPLECEAVYVEGASSRCLVAALDLVQLSREFCDGLRASLARRLGLGAHEVFTHCTHAHSTPFENVLREGGGVEALAARIEAASREAIDGARPALMDLVEVRPPRRMNVTRRQRVAECGGAITMWSGFRMEGDRPDAGPVVRERWRGITGSDDVPGSLRGPVWYERPVDDLIQMLVFRRDGAAKSPAGTGPLGAILRFSAHGVSAFHTSDRRWGGDFPCFARESVSRRLGAPCAFLSGPCGDIAPVEQGIPLAVRRDSPGPSPFVPARYPTPEAAFAEARRQGEAIADCALSAKPKLPPEPLARAGSSLLRVELAMRESIPETADEGRAIHKQAGAEFERARAAREPLEVLRPLADRMLHASYMPLMHEEYYYASREEIRARRFAVELPRIELNGVLIAGFPGEAGQKASFGLREALVRPVVAVTEMNGDAAYMPPEEEFPDGDYEVNCAIIEPGGLEKLVAAHLAAERTGCSL